MPALNVDIVFVLDASESMKPCFENLREHIRQIYAPMQGYVMNVRLGLLTHSAGQINGKVVYAHQFLGGLGDEVMKELYGESQGSALVDSIFTKDPEVFREALGKVNCAGNEEMLVALDTAMDFPFGPIDSTKRVIAMFSDEPLEKGIEAGLYNDKISDLIDKLHARSIKLFAALPGSDPLWELAQANESEIEDIEGGDGLINLDFSRLLAQMGKSISNTSLQTMNEPAYQRALFRQDQWWREGRNVNEVNLEEALACGEIAGMNVQAGSLGVILDVSPSMKQYLPALRRQITSSFPDAEYVEVNGCGIFQRGKITYLSQDKSEAFHQLIERSQHDTIFWFSDFIDRCEPNALEALREIVVGHTKIYCRSVKSNTPGENTELSSIILDSGGEIKRGNIVEDLS
jgi:hypothetical protein